MDKPELSLCFLLPSENISGLLSQSAKPLTSQAGEGKLLNTVLIEKEQSQEGIDMRLSKGSSIASALEHKLRYGHFLSSHCISSIDF